MPRSGFGIYSENNRIYIFGGTKDGYTGPTNDVILMNISNGEIEKLKPMPMKICNIQCTGHSNEGKPNESDDS